MTLDLETLHEELRRDEGLPGGRPALTPYRDTVGKLTLGYGRNLEIGITRLEAEDLLTNDIAAALGGLSSRLPWFPRLDPMRQRVLVNMAVNLGIAGVLGFHRALEACRTGDYETAADEMLNSKWAIQVGDRAKRLARMMRTGVV